MMERGGWTADIVDSTRNDARWHTLLYAV